MIKLILIMFISIFCSFNSYALPKHTSTPTTYFEKQPVGDVKKSESQIILGDKVYSLYDFQGILHIPISYLQEIGASMHTTEDGVIITLSEVSIPSQEVVFEETLAYLNPHTVYIGNLKTYSLLVEDDILIPLDALAIFWNITEYMNQYSLTVNPYNLNNYIQIEETQITNLSPYLLRLSYKDIFWDTQDYKEILHEDVLLEQGEVLKRDLTLEAHKTAIHLTTILVDIYELPHDVESTNPYGQKNTALFNIYEKALRLQQLEKIFVPYVVTGTIKYPVGSFKTKDEVVVWRGEKRQYYVVLDAAHKKVLVPWGSLDIVGDLGVKWPQATTSQIEDYANLKGMTSDTSYLVWTDLYRQRTYILKGSKEAWQVEKIMVCSSGRNTYLTPRGEFKLEYRIPYFGMGKGFMCKNAVVIFRDYMYHSILFDKTGQYVKEGKYQLGQRVSHGCIRLSEEDSAWIYKHIPLETTVWIN